MKSLSHVQLCGPMDCSRPDSSIHGIFQARVLEVANTFPGFPYRPMPNTPGGRRGVLLFTRSEMFYLKVTIMHSKQRGFYGCIKCLVWESICLSHFFWLFLRRWVDNSMKAVTSLKLPLILKTSPHFLKPLDIYMFSSISCLSVLYCCC